VDFELCNLADVFFLYTLTKVEKVEKHKAHLPYYVCQYLTVQVFFYIVMYCSTLQKQSH